MSPKPKQFCFNDYDVIGFDLDGTILRYNLNEMIPLEYELLSKFLVEWKGYSGELLLQPYGNAGENHFIQKGLILDAGRGNLLKLSAKGSILRASHGTTLLTESEIASIYGANKLWEISSQFLVNPLSTWNGSDSEKMRALLDYFDIIVSLVFARAVDTLDAQVGLQSSKTMTGYKIWPDILDGLVYIYSRENFSNGKSKYFEALRSETSRFLLKTSPNVIAWLKDLRKSGKATFLLTGSNIDFVNLTASYALGHNWQELFDNVICFGRKPGFFTENRSFYKLDGFNEICPIICDESLELNRIYTQGNWKQLRKVLAKKVGKIPTEVRSLYVGDNLIQDMYTPTTQAEIDSIVISEEMLIENELTFEFNEVLTSSQYWNSYFSVDNEATLWADMVAKYSQMCIPSLDSIADKPVEFRFVFNNPDGYYPAPPDSV